MMQTTKKQAAIMFNLPNEFRYSVVEGKGNEDARLRRAIKASLKTFNRIYQSEEPEVRHD